MSTFYQVDATITRRDAEGWTSTRQIPTFYLNSDVQGMLSVEHARRVADDVIATIAGPVAPGTEVGWQTSVIEAPPPIA
jgi:hypothetical protein